MTKKRRIRALDMYCGGGGTSTGLAHACKEMGFEPILIAVNHWKLAVATHSRNHPWAKHICASVESLDPTEVVPSRKLDILVASPECRWYSVARGGRPMKDQQRASPWQILRWLELLHVESALIENVPEIRNWGPLTAAGRPVKNRLGETYKAWMQGIRSLGYNVGARVLNAADYGGCTSRRRLFVIARRGKKPVHWPEPAFSRDGKEGTEKWRAAREIIDWSLEGQSIFNRKRPLAPATMRRIIQGLERFGGPGLKPFLVILRGTSTGQSMERPVPGLTAGGNHIGLAKPFLLHLTHGGRVNDIEEPIPTVTGAHRGEIGVVEPFILSQASGGAPRDVKDPVPTIPGGGAHALVQPFILPPEGIHRGNAPRSPDDPLQTVTQRGGGHLVQPFLVPNFGERKGQDPRTHSVDDPLPAITSHGAGALVEPYLVEYYGNGQPRSVDEPLPTVTTKDRMGLVRPTMNRAEPRTATLDEPVPTVTGKDEIMLVQPTVDGWALDIKFRMLQPHELARAMGFGDDYKFSGNRQEIVKQIGNAVEVHVAKALCLTLLRGSKQPVLDVLEENT